MKKSFRSIIYNEMEMEKPLFLPFFGILLLLTVGCVFGGQAAATPQPTPTRTLSAEPTPSNTEAATLVPVELVTPTATTPPPPELDEIELPYKMGYSFLVDPEKWEVVLEFDDATGDYFFLRHQADSGCQINMVPERPYAPLTRTDENIGGRNWAIFDNIRFTLLDDNIVTLNLHAPSGECRADQLQVLTTLSLIDQRGEPFPTETALPTPTSLADSGFECPGAPAPRLKIGMAARMMAAETPLLYTGPVEALGAVDRQLSADEGLTFHITDGPTCLSLDDGVYLYWEVSIPETWEEGWVAEGTGDVYILEPYEP
jgi:hypothetical protein